MSIQPIPINHKPKGLFQVMREKMRLAHMSLFTEKNYIQWVRQLVALHHGKHPREMGVDEITQLLTHLAAVKNVAGSTQNQALNAIVYLYKHVLNKEAGIFEGIVWARKPKHIPVVLSVEEVKAVLKNLKGVQKVIGCLLYGTRMRLTEALKLRVKYVDFDRNLIIVRDAKGAEDRSIQFPQFLKEPLRKQLERAKAIHDYDLKEGFGRMTLPYALERKYPNANAEGSGSMFFRHSNDQLIHRPEKLVDGIFIQPLCKIPSQEQLKSWNPKESRLPYFPAQFCYAPSGPRSRYTHSASTAWS